jgi:nitrate reductase delta subunit
VTTFDERSVRRLLAVASMLLAYPEQATVERLDAVEANAATLPAGSAPGVLALTAWLRSTDLVATQAHYVEIFDRRRRACLYLTYFLNGDTRRRGMALVGFKEAYQAAGFDIGSEELPDFLPVVLEFGAVGDVAVALELLAQHRSGIEVLSAALHRFSSPYADVVEALLVVVPEAPHGPTAQELAAAGPPSEVVGLAPFFPVDSLEAGARS